LTDKYAALKNNVPYSRVRRNSVAQEDFKPKTEEELKVLRERIRENKEKGKKPAKQQKLATIKLHINIASHDLEIKHRKIAEELKSGNQVKMVLVLQGREKSRPIPAVAWLNEQTIPHEEYAVFNKPATVENMSIVLFPALHKPKNKGTTAQTPPQTKNNKEEKNND
jgi:hypothetical protein